MIKKKVKNTGFTLIETLIYTLLIVLLMTGLVSFSLSLFGMHAKAKSIEEVLASAKFIDSVFSYYIEDMAGSDVFASYSGASSSLELVLKNSDNLKIFFANGSMFLRKNNETALKLSSSEVVINDFVITDLSSGEATSSYRISCNISYFASDSIPFRYSYKFLGTYNLNNET